MFAQLHVYTAVCLQIIENILLLTVIMAHNDYMISDSEKKKLHNFLNSKICCDLDIVLHKSRRDNKQ